MMVARFQCFRTDRQLVRWRLLGGNNRVLGMSMRLLEDHSTAMAEVELVRQYAGKVDFELDHVSSGLWTWRMDFPVPEMIEPGTVATSSRGFARRVDASLSAERFRERAQEADLDWTLAIYQTGRRSRVVPFTRSHE
jgi:hypothetical protein